ncbi:MAG: hypothetical protein ACRCUK_00220 [Plesiomonas shigelloides]
MAAASAMGMSMCVFMIVLVRMVMVSSMLATCVLMRRGYGLSRRGFAD